MSIKITKRELAVQFVNLLGDRPLGDLATALVAAAFESGYSRRDIPALIAAVEHELHARYGVVEVGITTAHQLADTDITAIGQKVATAAGATSFNIVDRVDPSLLGGFEATADGTTIRDSIRFNLTNSGALNA